jgi:hypothetical protein
VGVPSGPQIVQLSAEGLPPKTTVTVEAPQGFQVASKSSGPWGRSLNIAASKLPASVFVRLSGNNAGYLPDYSFSGTVQAFTTNANAAASVSGNTFPAITLGASATKLAPFSTTQGVHSASQRLLFGPNAPCIFTGPITITAPSGFALSLDGVIYTTEPISYTVPESQNGQQWVNTLFVRISSQAAKGSYKGSVILNTKGLPTATKISVSGSVK